MLPLYAQTTRTPTARLVSASRFDLPGEIDSSNPLAWSLVDGVNRLFVLTSWGGVPVRSSGASLETLQPGAPVAFSSHPGNGVWMEAIIPDEAGAWYGYYHHERPADSCGRPDRQLPRLGAMRSVIRARRGRTSASSSTRRPAARPATRPIVSCWAGSAMSPRCSTPTARTCISTSASTPREAALQGVAVARIAWADRDAPVGKAAIWNDGAWLPASRADESMPFTYPAGTPLVKASRPFHDRSGRPTTCSGARPSTGTPISSST